MFDEARVIPATFKDIKPKFHSFSIGETLFSSKSEEVIARNQQKTIQPPKYPIFINIFKDIKKRPLCKHKSLFL